MSEEVTIKGQEVRELPIQLTDDEINERGRELPIVLEEIDRIEEEKKNRIREANLEYNITVLDGGVLTINSGSHLTTDDPTYLSTIKIHKGATFSCTDSIIDNFGEGNTGAIWIESDDVIINNCEITTTGNGVNVYNATGVEIYNNEIITDTTSSSSGVCVKLEYANGTIVRGNSFNKRES